MALASLLCSKSENQGAGGGGLYVHVAYCRSKCIYCDFFSAGNRIADWRKYVEAICSEFKYRLKELAWPLRTVYFGGGTPSLMPEEEFLRLCAFLNPYMSEVDEFTIEVNPDDIDEHMLEVWKRAGVNRLSMGIQTFDEVALKKIGRRHTGQTAILAYSLAEKYFDNISIDLMFGLPGQTLEIWKRDLRIALELKPQHISAYSLMYENGTALTTLRDKGRIEEASEELIEEMFLELIDALRDAGYDHYEISNFALSGFRSKHNASYWAQKPYLGLGPSAHSYDGFRIRKSNRSDLRGYLAYWSDTSLKDGKIIDTLTDVECLSDVELLDEYLMTRLRTKEGILMSDFSVRFGHEVLVRLINSCNHWVNEGMISISDSHISITEKAVLLSDTVILDIASRF